MNERAVRRADHRGRVASPRVVAYHPPGDILSTNLAQLLRRYGLAATAPRVYLLAYPPGQSVYGRYKRFHKRLDARRHRPGHWKILTVQVVAEGAQHRRLGVEVRDILGRLQVVRPLSPLTSAGTLMWGSFSSMPSSSA